MAAVASPSFTLRDLEHPLDTRVDWQARCSCGHVQNSLFVPTRAGEIDQKAQRVLLGQKAQTKTVATRTAQEVAQIRRLCRNGVATCPPRKRSGGCPHPRTRAGAPALALAAPAASFRLNLWACLASSAQCHPICKPAVAELNPEKCLRLSPFASNSSWAPCSGTCHSIIPLSWLCRNKLSLRRIWEPHRHPNGMTCVVKTVRDRP